MLSSRNRIRPRMLLLGFLLIAVFLLSFCLGRYAVPLGQTVRILTHGIGTALSHGLDALFPGFAEQTPSIFPLTQTWDARMENVILQIRLPRILLACLVGGCLAAAGAAYQGVFQNPMAAPDLLGAASGAAFGAALGILLGVGKHTVTLFAFFSSLVTVALVCLTASRAPGKRSMNLILSGIMVGSLFTSATSYVKLVADPADQLPAITYWLMGSLSAARLSDAAYALLPMAAGLVPLLLLRWRINLLTLGDNEARSMGINTDRLRLTVVFCATLITAAAISVSGMIGWVGLIVPHLCRRLFGSDYRWLMPASVLMGALFLLLVDNISRSLTATEIPIGILTALIGAPFFLFLMMRKGGFR